LLLFLECISCLHTLNLARNRLDDAALTSLEGMSGLRSLDVSSNRVQNIETLKMFIQVVSLNSKENPVNRVPNFRMILIASNRQLRYLDETGVAERDRRLALAFLKGGEPAYLQELEKISLESNTEKSKKTRSRKLWKEQHKNDPLPQVAALLTQQSEHYTGSASSDGDDVSASSWYSLD
jgi:hypothetical protein